MIRKQVAFTPFAKAAAEKPEEFLPLADALKLQNRMQEGSAGIKFNLEWYMKNGAHLL